MDAGTLNQTQTGQTQTGQTQTGHTQTGRRRVVRCMGLGYATKAETRPGKPPTRRRLSLLAALAVLVAIVAALAGAAGGVSAQQARAFSSAQEAIDSGLGAYQAGRREAAIAALTEAAARGEALEKFVAEFYLARIYSQNLGGGADNTKAFVLFRKIADENLNVDPETSQRAPFVAKALIALAGYVRAGIKEIDLPPSATRANDYLHHAAVFFGDKDAQFELARVYLGGDANGLGGGANGDDIRRGLHYLSALTEESYAPAQAALADLFWRGQYVKKDEQRALALATMATEGAPEHERIWIEDTYATLFCASTPPARTAAGQLVARWRKMFPPPLAEPTMGLGARELLPERQCASGEKVALRPSVEAAEPAEPQPVGRGLLKGPGKGPSKGLSSGPGTPGGFHAAGVIEPTAAKE
ncbi:MAG: hypothetical protein J2P50_04855 [Hyphomicrobiaceae bacterium]|nr:hypothetical protein [Hyphomicrobiaceae bacterium]